MLNDTALHPQLFWFGVTSIRGMADDVDALFTWNRSQSGDRPKGPCMLIAGPFITIGRS